MSAFRKLASAVLVLAGLAALPHTAAAQTGEIVEAVQPVRLYLDGEQTRLDVGDTVKVGDTVLTGEGASAQILFQDETKIVVGPNSQMKLDNLLFRKDNTARKFAVRATRGTFRFLSGNSPKEAYSVKTPIATMGVRGTVFDFTVPSRRNTDLLVHDGEVQFCRRGRNSCATVQRGCQTIQMDSRRWNQPQTEGERSSLLAALFPFAISQDRLRPEFRANIGACESSDSSRPVAQVRVRSTGNPLRESSPSSAPSGGGSGNPAE